MLTIANESTGYLTSQVEVDCDIPLGEMTRWGITRAIGSIGVACITDCALRVIGAPEAVRIGFAAIPVTVGIVGIGAAVIGGTSLGVLCLYGLAHRDHY